MRLITVGLISTMVALAHGSAEAQLLGHGGPIRALSVAADGATALSGSFDTSAIRWSLRDNTAEQVLRFHQGAVDAVAMLADGRAATAGQDARIALWTPGKQEPDRVLEGHQGPIVALAISPDGATLASASWDRTIRLWPLAGGAPQVLEGHQQSVNGVAFTPDGTAIVSAGYDATVHIWRLNEPTSPPVVPLPTPLNAVTVSPEGDIIAAGSDGMVYFLSPAENQRDALRASSTPVTSLAISRNGEFIAAASIGGEVTIIDRRTRRVARSLAGPGLPVWSVAFLLDNHTLLTGGADRIIRRWDFTTGKPTGTVATGGSEDPLAVYAGEPGAHVFRSCVACHTLKPDEGNRAGPTLHGIFGRRIASLPGYDFSVALRQLDIVWTPQTLARLFEVGPANYTPGTKMPEQRIGAPEDRDALVRFLERATQ
jgi:cytochrome c